MDRPKVLFVSHTSALGGAEICLLDTIRAYRGECEVLLLEDGALAGRLRAGGAKVICLPVQLLTIKRHRSLLRAVPLLPRLISTSIAIAKHSRRFDVIYANSHKAFLLSVLAAITARKPLIYHLHVMLSDPDFAKWQRHLVVTFANGCADRVIANSHRTSEAFIGLGGNQHKVSVICNGFDPAAYAPRPEEARRATRTRYCGSGDFLVGVFGRLCPWKGQHVVLEALALLENVVALFVGAPLFGHERYAEELLTLADELRVARRVHFLGFREDIADLMSAADATVVPSMAPEGFGRVIVESMLCQRAVVASDSSNVDDVVTHGVNGLLFRAGDARALAAAIRRLQSDFALRQRLAANAHEDAIRRFNYECFVDQSNRSIEEVCDEQMLLENALENDRKERLRSGGLDGRTR